MELSSEKREKKIAEVTLVGSVVNLVLSVGKIAAGCSGAALPWLLTEYILCRIFSVT